MNGRAPVTNPAAAMRLVRVMKIFFVVSMLFFLYMVMKLPATAAQTPDAMLEMVLTILALANIANGFVVPRYILRAPQRAQGDPNQATLVQRWFTANVLGFAFLESCGLFGVVLHFLGADLRRSELLIGVGIVAIVFFSPGAVPDSGSGPTLPL
jgi:F0F1-type ATP synthase membrane subunit c/vacuolar-type H+-ATPase subunit K